LPGGTEEKHNKPPDRIAGGWDLNQAPQEYKAETLLLKPTCLLTSCLLLRWCNDILSKCDMAYFINFHNHLLWIVIVCCCGLHSLLWKPQILWSLKSLLIWQL
jgi:hypothetical protein